MLSDNDVFYCFIPSISKLGALAVRLAIALYV